MAKRIQPKLHNNKTELVLAGYHYGACNASEGVLLYLWLADIARDDEERNKCEKRAHAQASRLLDYVSLREFELQVCPVEGTDHYLEKAAIDNRKYAPYREKARELLETIETSALGRRAA